jgi:LmbE family N-acetylglucosaminyl deacetylase
VITHPPHGGEKPHPHHIQSYVATKKLCKSYHVGFGFFCETKLLNVAMDSNVFRLNGDTKKYILLRLIKACQFLKNDKLQIAYIVKFSFSVLFDFNKYSAFEQEVDLIAKKDALLFFESQIVHLKTYAHYNNISEFLYLELPHHFG